MYGIYGEGFISPEAVAEHVGRLADAAQVDGGEVWFLVHIPENPTEGLINVVAWLNENDAWWIGFSDSDEFDEDLYEGSQEEPVVVKNIGRKFLSWFKKEDDVALLALYTDGGDSDAMSEVLDIVTSAKYLAQDLSDGLTPIEMTDDDEEEVPEEAEEPAKEEGRYTREELEGLELKELRALALAEGKTWAKLHHSQSNKMRKAALIEYFLGEGEAPEAVEEEEAPAEAVATSRRGRGRPAAVKEEPAEEPVAKTLPSNTLGVREILVKHLTALLEELQG